jgi:glycosyltransferase involved in cell wall biosynthesis
VKIALLVPVFARGRDRETLRRVHRHNLAQSRSLAQLGAEVHLFVDAPFADVEREAGVHLHFVSGALTAIPGAHLLAAALFERPDVVHQFHLLDVRTLALLALAPARVFAEYNTGPIPHQVARRAVMRAATARLGAVFFTAAEMADPFREAGALSARTPVVAVPETSSILSLAERESSRRTLGVEHALVVLVVARAAEGKDPNTALAAFERIKQARPEAHLLWAALEEGPLHAEVSARVASLGGRMYLRTEMPPLYAAADVMLHPSRREACGTAFMEALSAGVPVVGSDIAPFRALARNDAAKIAPVGDSSRFAELALALAQDPSARQRAKRRFADALTFDAIALRKLRTYEGKTVSPEY